MNRTWYAQLDGLRFIAISAVLVEHFVWFIGHPLHFGFFGVDLFFVLSGFLITEGLLIDKENDGNNGKTLKKFYVKRFLRIFPIYYLFLILAFIFSPEFKVYAPWAFTYTINYYYAFTGTEVLSTYRPLWSLSVEEQFYTFWPLCLLFIRMRFLPLFFILVFSGSMIYFLVTQEYLTLPARMYSLCGGGILAYLKYSFPDRYSSIPVRKFYFVLGAAFLVYFIHHSVGVSLVSFGLVYLGSNNAFSGFFKKVFENKRIMHVGKISYGVYLYHMPVANLLTVYFFNPIWNNIDFGETFRLLKYNSWLIKFPLYSIVSIMVANLSYYVIEKPILRWKDKLYGRKHQQQKVLEANQRTGDPGEVSQQMLKV